jgi:hypothetical protein
MNSQALPENILRRLDPKDRQPLGKHGRIAPERKAELDAKMETTLHNLLMQYLQLQEIFYIHSQFGKRTRSTKGTPDFCFAINGQAMAIECKAEYGELSEDQEKAIERMRSNGWAIEICTTLGQAIGFIQRFKK